METSGDNTVFTDKQYLGVGTSNVSNLGGWQRVMEVNGDNYSKSLVSCVNNNVTLGLYAHETWGGNSGTGSIGTESNHPLRLLTNYEEKNENY